MKAALIFVSFSGTGFGQAKGDLRNKNEILLMDSLLALEPRAKDSFREGEEGVRRLH